MRNERSSSTGLDDIFQRFFASGFDISKLLQLPELTQEERNHLCNVYSTLLAGVMGTGIGAAGGLMAADAEILSSNSIGLIGMLASLACVFVIASERATNIGGISKGSSGREIVAFGGLSVSTGLTLTGLVGLALFVNSQLLMTAFMGSISTFASLTLAALFAPRGSFFWLGALASSLVSYMLLGQLFNIFLGSHVLFNGLTYLGVIASVIYTLVDTQVIAESTRMGHRNVISHALQIYYDLVNLFVRILTILLDNEERKKKRRR